MQKIIPFLLTLLLLSGCGPAGDTPQDIEKTSKKTSPIITLSTSSNTLEVGTTIKLSTEVKPSILSYEWKDQFGTLLSTSHQVTWVAPRELGIYAIKLTVIDKNYKSYSSTTLLTVIEAKDAYLPDDGTFRPIKNLISRANQGYIQNATYICVGDSTRAESRHQGQYLFYALRDSLKQYNVTSYLQARAGHEINQYLHETLSPTLSETVSLIPGDGANAIVDISLGINDYWYLDTDTIKPNIRKSIEKIRAQKPRTHFMLTMPDRAYNNNYMTDQLKRIYMELSQEMHIPLNNLVDDLMPSRAATPFSWYRNDGFFVHLSRDGQRVVSDYILGNILP